MSLNTHQVSYYMTQRKKGVTQHISAMKAGISVRSGRRIEKDQWSKTGSRHWRTRKDPLIRQEWVIRQCVACGGKGAINARCRCGGSGQVLDRKATKERGAPVYKTCERCSGNGFSTAPSTDAYKAILTLIPDLHARTWTRNWKPFCDALVDICWKEERHADKEFQQATSF